MNLRGKCIFQSLFENVVYTQTIIQKQTNFIELNLPCFTNGLTTFVKAKGAVDQVNGRSVKTKSLTMLLILREKLW